VRRRDADEAALDGARQNLAVLRQHVVRADVRQDFREDVAEFDVAEVAFLDAFTTDAVSRVTDEVRLCTTATQQSR